MNTINRSLHTLGILEDSLKEELLDVRDEISRYANANYGEIIYDNWLKLCEQHPIFLECEETAFMPFTSWYTFCSPIKFNQQTIYSSFLTHHLPLIKNELHSYTLKTLNFWQQCYPSFYYQPEFKVKRIFPLLDIYNGILKTTVSYSDIFIAPKRNDFMTGLLLPLGDGSFTPHYPMLSLPDKLRNDVSTELVTYCKSRWHLSPEDVIKKEYPVLLAIFFKYYMSLPENERIYYPIDQYYQPSF
ncbi:hypothetical protein [Salipaludibacillus sp. CF4.18]|uniref:hypothetical protein n=1 Tax=Salipaludibacillus sp. CF4.18 TaxID=3373081 RepID=UPI003EE74C23